jgi:hypothetical protein
MDEGRRGDALNAGSASDDDGPPQGGYTVRDWLGELDVELDELRAQVALLRSGLREEVRTRRLVVVEDDGFPRVVAEAQGLYGGVEVRSRAGERPAVASGLFVVDAGDGDPANAGAQLSDAGDVVALLDVSGGRSPRLS